MQVNCLTIPNFIIVSFTSSPILRANNLLYLKRGGVHSRNNGYTTFTAHSLVFYAI